MITVAVAAVAGPAFAGPALAHVEVTADKTRAGATDVTLSFHGEAENDAAGITGERVVLPDGIAPQQVTLVKAPAGWRFARTADGFTVGGKALAVGTDAKWSVRVAKLPDGVTRLSFRTLETYADGEVARWIEIQEPGQPEPDNPAPLITLKAAPAASTSPPAASSAPPAVSSTPPAPAAATVAADPVAVESDTSRRWLWALAGVIAVGAGAAVLVIRRRRG